MILASSSLLHMDFILLAPKAEEARRATKKKAIISFPILFGGSKNIGISNN